MALHLLSLPQEVRNTIYEQLFDDFDDLVMHIAEMWEMDQGETFFGSRAILSGYQAVLKSQRHWSAPQTLGQTRGILTICKQLYQEIMSFIYSHLPILIDGPALASGHLIGTLPAPLTTAHVANVGNLVLDCRNITVEAVPTQQQQDIVAKFPALRRVTVLAQSSLVQALGCPIDVTRLRADPMSAYDLIEDEDTKSAVKRRSISTWSKYERCHLKNGSGRPVNLEMSFEVGCFAIDRYHSEVLPSVNSIMHRPHQPSRHRVLGGVLVVKVRADGNGGCNVSVKPSPEFRKLHDEMLLTRTMWKWWYIDFCYP